MTALRRVLPWFVCLLASLAHAADGTVGTIYVKNNGQAMADIWVNDAYQGYVRGGHCYYTVSDGFVTNDSGRPTAEGGRTPVEESHAGWEGTGPVVMKFRFWGGDGIRYLGQITLEGDVEKNAYVSIGENDPGLPPDDIEAEHAPAILKGTPRAPKDWVGKFTGDIPMNGSDDRTWTNRVSMMFDPNNPEGRIKFSLNSAATEEVKGSAKDDGIAFGMRRPTSVDVYKIVPDEDGGGITMTILGRNTYGPNKDQTFKGSGTLAPVEGTAKARALKTGDVQVTVAWTGGPDVDLAVTDPDGNTIDFQHKSAPNGGQLDVDDQDGGGPENIVWPAGRAPEGAYRVVLTLFKGSQAQCKVRILNGSEHKSYSVALAGEKDAQVVTEFKNPPRANAE